MSRGRQLQGLLQRGFLRCDAVTDRQLFLFTILWVVVGGLVLQMVVLPYFVPQAYWGHGLIADLDSLGYHIWGAEQAAKIRSQGWGAWELRPRGHSMAGIVSIFYLLHPEPWVLLPLNGVLFAVAVTATRRLLATMFASSGVALAAVLPFFLYPSFVSIWGQLQKDLLTGAGLALVLYAFVLAAHKRDQRSGLIRLVLGAAIGMGLVWLARPYGMVPVGVATAAAGVLVLPARPSASFRVLPVVAVILLATWSGLQGWQERELPSAPAVPPPSTATTPAVAIPPAVPTVPRRKDGITPEPAPHEPPAGTKPAAPPPSAVAVRAPGAWLSSLQAIVPRTRLIDPSMPTYAPCAPYPTRNLVDKTLFSICAVREGFIGDAERHNASSGYDYDIRLRSLEDFVAYVPNAVEASILQPGPTRWGTERSPIGRLASLFVPFEMVSAYVAFILALVVARKRLVRADLWAVVVFCISYTLIFVYTMPQMGTLYRMRAFPFATIVSLALAILFSRMATKEERPLS